MKINRLLAIIALTLFAKSISASANVIIMGNVESIPDSTIVALFHREGSSASSIAMDTVIDGKFCLSVPVDSGLIKTDLNFYKDGTASRFRTLYLRPDAKITINVNDPYVETWNVTSNVPEQKEYDHFIEKSRDLLNVLQKDSKFTHIVQPNTEVDSITSVISKTELTKSMHDSLQAEIYLRDLDLLQEMPVSIVWLDKMESIARSYKNFEPYSTLMKEKLLILYENLDDLNKNSIQAVTVNTLLNPDKLKKGDLMPNLVLKDLDGCRHTLSEVKGKWILLDFWSGGCLPCIRAIPELHEFENQYSDELAVVSISIDSEKMWRAASESFNLTGNNWIDGKADMGIYRKFGDGGVPIFVLISPDGVIKEIWMGYEQGCFERQYKLCNSQKNQH